MIREWLCSICFQPIELKKSKTDENGRSVHEECYAMKMAAMPPKKPTHRLRMFSLHKRRG